MKKINNHIKNRNDGKFNFHIKKRLNRSLSGDLSIFLFLFVFAVFTAIPMIYAFVNAFKPLDELWIFPPPLYVRNPTFKNFTDLFILLSNSWVPFWRYLFNTLFITFFGTIGNIVFASICAYPLAKDRFPGSKIFFKIVVLSLMFNTTVIAIPNYLTMANLHWLNTYQAIIIPAMGLPLGLFLMKQFMEQIPDSLIEAARIDGANQWTTFWRIVMPNMKPAWLTLSIFSVQGLWNLGQSNYIYSEQFKTLPYALSQVASAGISRAGVSAAITVIMMIVPISLFIFAQSSILETMTTAGIKE